MKFVLLVEEHLLGAESRQPSYVLSEWPYWLARPVLVLSKTGGRGVIQTAPLVRLLPWMLAEGVIRTAMLGMKVLVSPATVPPPEIVGRGVYLVRFCRRKGSKVLKIVRG
jgi:hypothetical protein